MNVQLSVVARRLDVCYIAASLSYIATTILCGVSLATMTAISVDRLFALLLKMRLQTSGNPQVCWSCRRLLLVPEHFGQHVGLWRQNCLFQYKLYVIVTERGDTSILFT